MPSMSGVEQLLCRSAPWRWWTRKVVLPWALQGVQIHGDVLEIGAGSGAMAAGILDTHSGVRLTVTDIEPKMVEATAKLLSHRTGVEVRQADATGLPFPDESFDYCVSNLMLHHVLGWKRALTEVHRILRPGGYLIGYDLTATCLARTIHIVDRSPHRLIAPGELQTELAKAGFDNPHVRAAFAGHVMRFSAQKKLGSQ